MKKKNLILGLTLGLATLTLSSCIDEGTKTIDVSFTSYCDNTNKCTFTPSLTEETQLLGGLLHSSSSLNASDYSYVWNFNGQSVTGNSSNGEATTTFSDTGDQNVTLTVTSKTKNELGTKSDPTYNVANHTIDWTFTALKYEKSKTSSHQLSGANSLFIEGSLDKNDTQVQIKCTASNILVKSGLKFDFGGKEFDTDYETETIDAFNLDSYQQLYDSNTIKLDTRTAYVDENSDFDSNLEPGAVITCTATENKASITHSVTV